MNTDELVRLEQRLDDHIADEIRYRKLLDDKLDPILEAINAGKLSYTFILKLIGLIASILGLFILIKQLK